MIMMLLINLDDTI